MFKLYADHYFHIGDVHLTAGKPCQDYAISDVGNGAIFAIVSDGCSKGRHTDIGSRLIALSTMTALKEHWMKFHSPFGENTTKEIGLHQKLRLSAAREILGLKPEDLFATSVYAYITAQGGFVQIQGDGIVALKYQEGNIITSRFEWLENAPFYPVYEDEALKNFILLQGNDLEALRLNEEKWEQKNGAWQKLEERKFSLSQGIQGVTLEISQEMLENNLEFIAVFSDGLNQIQGVDWKDALANFTGFKGRAGEFAKRRMISGIRDYKANGHKLYDDLAFAVVRIELEEVIKSES